MLIYVGFEGQMYIPKFCRSPMALHTPTLPSLRPRAVTTQALFHFLLSLTKLAR